ncbi:MAG TPA: HD domain-containing protein [Candidatus Methylomirabilis sp.]|nr:HD domain-containing protein [Candidatus Methylomirabilis sp.]
MNPPAYVSIGAFPDVARRALKRLTELLGSRPGWLVGGALRQALLGEMVRDLDIAVSSDALTLGKTLARELPRASFVPLDEPRGICRVVWEIQLDIADLRAPGLAADLERRDFTVNALAASLHDLVRRGSASVEDATGGLEDLAARVIRPCGPGVIGDDPLRALRAVRLAMKPGWHLDPGAEVAIREAAPRVAAVSAERVRDELAAILAAPRAASGLRLLDRLSVLTVLLPESRAMRETSQPEPHRFDVWEHSLRAVDAADELLPHADALGLGGPEMAVHLGEALGDRLTRRETLKLAALLHDVAKPQTKTVEGGRIRFFGHDTVGADRAADIALRWRLSRRASLVVSTLVRHHLRPMHLANAGGVTRRARYRFFRDLGNEARDLVLLSLADAAAVRGDSPLAVWEGTGGAILRDLMRSAGGEEQAAGAPPLLRGEDVMAAFGLAPGPTVGILLARAREAQALGAVASRAEAIEYLRRFGGPSLDTSSDGP